MAQRDKETRKFEEMNPFTEKVGAGKAIDASSDDSDIIYWDPDAGIVSMEEVRLPAAAAAKPSRAIEDEEPHSAKPAVKAKPVPVPSAPRKHASAGFNIEELAREIDSMDLSSSAGLTVSPIRKDEDFLSVLDDDQLNLIDEVVSSTDGFDEVGSVDIIEIEDEPLHDKVSVVEEIEGLIESKPLWADDEDFWVVDAEGFGVAPHELLAFISGKGAEKEKTPVSEPEKIKPAAEPVKAPEGSAVSGKPEPVNMPFADKPYILSCEKDSFLVDMGRLIDGAPEPEKEIAAEEIVIESSGMPSADGDDDIIIVDPVYLDGNSHFDSIVNTEQAETAADFTIERFVPEEELSEKKSANAAEPAKEEAEPPVYESPAKMKLPDSFTLTPIDLGEAEKIAHEDILFLSEDDLIEELELRDLVPLEEDKPGVQKKEEAPVREPSYKKKGDYIYITPEQSNITDDSRKDIESDVQASDALIIEEDVQEISRRLRDFEESAPAEQLFDITDRVVILEEEADVERFVSAIPEHKRDDMKRLLNYLDGLFEKLPEDVVKNFADSEYFDLYVKIMNDLSE